MMIDKSTHKVEVVPVHFEKHPNADALSVVKVHSAYTVCVKTADWKDGDLGAYIPPDSVVDTKRPEFAWLEGHARIKVKRLRGVISMGLLVPAPAGSKAGDDVAEILGVTHYDPPIPLSSGGEAESPPPGYRPCFDVDSLRRYADKFVPDEPVSISEKIHGASGRWCYVNGRMYCGSRTEWKREDDKNLWWRALKAHPEVEQFCKDHPEYTVYGEVYGQVQDLKYGVKNGEVHIAVFDILHGTRWLNVDEARIEGDTLPWVPLFSLAMPFDLNEILDLAEGPSIVPGANHIREGIVVRPIDERTDLEIGRVCLKVVSNGYLER